jgi:hypothetical protein
VTLPRFEYQQPPESFHHTQLTFVAFLRAIVSRSEQSASGVKAARKRAVREALRRCEATTDDEAQSSLLLSQKTASGGIQRHYAITGEGAAHFQAAYPVETIAKDDLFYYVYGMLHSEDYRSRYADNLSKELPSIPAVKKVDDFWAFVTAGRKLGDLHCNYEAAEPYPIVFTRGDPGDPWSGMQSAGPSTHRRPGPPGSAVPCRVSLRRFRRCGSSRVYRGRRIRAAEGIGLRSKPTIFAALSKSMRRA